MLKVLNIRNSSNIFPVLKYCYFLDIAGSVLIDPIDQGLGIELLRCIISNQDFDVGIRLVKN